MNNYLNTRDDEERERVRQLKAPALSTEMHKRWEDPEYRQKRSIEVSKQMREFWDNPENEEMQNVMISKLHEGRDNYYKNNAEERAMKRESKKPKIPFSERRKLNALAYWASLSEEEKNRRTSEMYKSLENYIKNMTPEQKESRAQKCRETRANWSEERKSQYSQELSKRNKDRWNSLTDEEKELYSIRGKLQWENMTEEEYIEQCAKFQAVWDRLSIGDRIKRLRLPAKKEDAMRCSS